MSSRVFFRSLATASKAVKPPVQLFGLDGTYAAALFTASAKDSTIEKSYQALGKVKELLQKDPKIQEYFSSPALSIDDRLIVVDTVSESLKLDKTVSNFLQVLAENNRLVEFDGVYKSFSVLNDANNGVVDATVTSAKPLDSKILKKLQASITKSSLVGEGKSLKLNNVVNPEILGGLIVEVGEKTVDASIVSKLGKLNNALKEAV